MTTSLMAYTDKPTLSSRDRRVLTDEPAGEWRSWDENARLLPERWSLTDALTALGNRRAFDRALWQDVARAQRNAADLALVLVDVDHFKLVNDSLGRPAGDGILISFAQRLLAIVRSSDRVFRYGGEEFALLLGDTDRLGAVALAERALASVADVPMTGGRRSVRLTCSAGVAELVWSDVSPDALLRRADSALYEAKRQGRNRVVSAARPPAGLERPRIVVAGGLAEGAC